MAYSIGDVLFFTVDGVAGEGIFIGNLKAAPGVVVLVVGKHAIEFDAGDCSGSKHGFSEEGEGLRRLYLRLHPGALV
jgi:hypothetical protein